VIISSNLLAFIAWSTIIIMRYANMPYVVMAGCGVLVLFR